MQMRCPFVANIKCAKIWNIKRHLCLWDIKGVLTKEMCAFVTRLCYGDNEYFVTKAHIKGNDPSTKKDRETRPETRNML